MTRWVSVSGKLRAMVGWILGEDLSARDAQPRQEARAPAPPKVQQRRSEGDGFDDTRPAPARSASAPRVEVSSLAGESSAELLAAATDFVASLDDLQDLAGQAAEPEPEFVPEGGMSTQSLMREFEQLAPELQAAAAELAAAEAAATHGSTEALISEVDALLVPAPPGPSLEAARVASPEEVSVAPPALLEAARVASPGSEVSAAAPAPSPLEAAATHSSTEALISEVDALLVSAASAPSLESAPPASPEGEVGAAPSAVPLAAAEPTSPEEVSAPAEKISGPEGAGVG